MTPTTKTVWVLTEEYNAYDQEGAYFLKVWLQKPTAQQVAVYLHSTLFSEAKHKSTPDDVNPELVQHILKGGGRRNDEDQWYILQEEDCT